MGTSYFTNEELNVIAIYHGITRDVTVASMSNISKYLKNSEKQRIMNHENMQNAIIT